jgi:hypothetical protein
MVYVTQIVRILWIVTKNPGAQRTLGIFTAYHPPPTNQVGAYTYENPR